MNDGRGAAIAKEPGLIAKLQETEKILGEMDTVLASIEQGLFGPSPEPDAPPKNAPSPPDTAAYLATKICQRAHLLTGFARDIQNRI